MANENDLIGRIGAHYAARRRADLDFILGKMLKIPESPIERVLLSALVAHGRLNADLYHVHWSLSPAGLGREPFDDAVFGYLQAPVGPYRVDFALVTFFGGRRKRVAVECDGHDFHERTKAQAAHDKKRDRYLQREGFQIHRFTGSEIWANPIKCAEEVFETLHRVMAAP